MKKFLIPIILSALLFGCSSAPKGPVVEQVENENITVSYLGNDIAGSYTGTLEDKMPNGEGVFKYSDDDGWKVTYTGNFELGALKGIGKLKDNKLTVNYDDELIVCEYEGDCVDGVANGEGTLRFEGSTSIYEFDYRGNFENGQMNGYGEREFITNNIYWCDEFGTFTNGRFTPTMPEAYISYGKCKDLSYKVNDEAKQFMIDHTDLFIEDTDYSQYVTATKFDYNSFAKNDLNYGSELFKISGLKLYQIQEFQDLGFDICWGNLSDRNGNTYSFRGFKWFKGVDLYDTVTIVGLPIKYTTFNNIAGGLTWTAQFVVVDIY